MRNYAAKVERGASPEDLEKSWDKINEETANWSSNLMINWIGLKEYYSGTEKADFFKDTIHPLFRTTTEDLADLKYLLIEANALKADSTQHTAASKMESLAKKIKEKLARINRSNNALNYKLYYLVNGTEATEESLLH